MYEIPLTEVTGHIWRIAVNYDKLGQPGVDLDMCLSVNTKLINTHPRVPVPCLWDRPSRKKSGLVFMGGLSQRDKITMCRCQKTSIF